MGSGIEVYLLIGLLGMIIVSFMHRKVYQVSALKIVCIMVALLIVGVAGTLVLYRIENGEWGGTSFFGSVFLIPIVFFLVAKIIKMPFGKLMDFLTIPVCAMLAIMKVRCILGPCCIGKVIYENSKGQFLRFPSQIVEMIVAVIIMVILLYLERKGGHKGKIYPYFLILYGATRFVLNWFRYGLTPFVLMLPNGNFWSIIAIILGVLWLLVLSQSHKRKA